MKAEAKYTVWRKFFDVCLCGLGTEELSDNELEIFLHIVTKNAHLGVQDLQVS